MAQLNTYSTNKIQAMGSGSLTLIADQKISLTSNIGEINLTAVGDRVILTANTISMIGTASIQGNLNVSGTITAGTIVGGSPLHIQASATVTIVATTLALNATRFISLLAPTKIQSGLLAPTPTHVSGYTLQPTSYIVCATLNNTSKTFYLPANPNDGEMYFTKAIPAVGGANATLTINTNGKTYDTDPATSNMILPTSGGGAGGSALIVYHSITNLWLVLTSFRATFS